MGEPSEAEGLASWLQRFQGVSARPGEFDASAQMAERLGGLAGTWSATLPFGAEPSGLFGRLTRGGDRP